MAGPAQESRPTKAVKRSGTNRRLVRWLCLATQNGFSEETVMATTLEPAPMSGPLLAEEPLYEIVDGQTVELPPMGIYAAYIASCLQGYLFVYAQTNQNGRAVAEGL